MQSGGYTAESASPAVTILAHGQILNGMTPDSPAAADKKEHAGRLVSHLHERVGQGGAGLHDDARRVGGSAERRLPAHGRQRDVCGRPGSRRASGPTGDIGFVGPYQPSTFNFGGFVKGVKPADLAGWDTPIPPKAK